MTIPRTYPVFGVGLDQMPRNAEEAKAFARAKNRQAHEQAEARAAGHARQMRELGAMTKPKAAVDTAAVYRKLNQAHQAEDGTAAPVLTLDDIQSAEPGTRPWRMATPAAPSKPKPAARTMGAVIRDYWRNERQSGVERETATLIATSARGGR